MSKADWVRVNRKLLCPCCGKNSWCLVAADGKACICARTESARRIGDAGWLHRLDQPLPPVRIVYSPTPNAPAASWSDYLAQCRSDTAPGDVRVLEASLGVTAESLTRLGCCRDAGQRAWAFPMYDPDGEVIGIRLRYDDGRKLSVKGSHNGLFIPDGWLADQADQVLVVEGPTDCAAALDIGYVAVGRPSCSAYVAETVRLLMGRDVVIVGDKDEWKTRPDGSRYRPGQDGARALAAALYGKARSIKLILPLKGKDLRQWKPSEAVLRCVINNANQWKPKKLPPK